MKESAPTRARDLVENFAAHGNYHFTSAEVKAALGVSSAAAKQALRRMSIKGLVASPARGFYVMVPPEYRRIGCLPPDQFIPDLMAHWNLPYYVGLLSAAQYYGAAHHRPQHFQVVLAKNRPPVLCGSVMVMFVARGDMAAVPTQDFNTLRGTVRASTAEATAVDLVGYAHRAGGIDRVAGLLMELAEVLDADRLVDAAMRSSVLWAQRLGYLLEHVGAADTAAPLKEYVRERAPNYTRLVPALDAHKTNRSRDWRLHVNARVEPDA